jgi:RNA polymerase sigma-70 factor (ECF subfamily)
MDDPLARAQRGDRDEQARILETHGPAVYGVCRRLAPDPDDCYQEIWEKVFAALARFDANGPAALSTWILTIAHRHLVDRHRRRRVRGVVVSLPDVTDEGPDPYARVSDEQRRRRLEHALSQLTDEHRRVVVLHHIHDLPLEAIAAVERVAVGTVKSRLHRARAELARHLEERP